MTSELDQTSPADRSPRRFGAATGYGGTCLTLLACVLVCGGFWLTDRAVRPTIFGWYALPWFVLSLVCTATIAVSGGLTVRFLLGPRPASPAAPDRLSLRKRLLFSCGMMLVVLGGIEICCRRLLADHPRSPSPRRISSHDQYHALLQLAERIDVNGTLRRSYRGRVYDKAQTTRLRIICLGGSTTWGHYLTPDQTWPRLLEDLLVDRGYDLEVINAAYPWYTTAHSVVNYALNMHYHEADVVVIMHGVNDLYRGFPRPGELPTEWDYGSYLGPLYDVLQRPHNAPRDTRPAALRWLASSGTYRYLCLLTDFDRTYYSALRSTEVAPTYPDTGDDSDLGPQHFETVSSFTSHLDYLVQLCRQDGRAVVLTTQANVYTRSSGMAEDQPPHTMRSQLFKSPGSGRVHRRAWPSA